MPVAVVTGAAGGIGQAVCALLVVRASPRRCLIDPRLPSLFLTPREQQEHGYTVVGIDRCVDTSAALSCTHMLHLDICELCAATTPEDEPPAKRAATPTPAKRLKSLLASLAPPGKAPGCDLLVCNAAVQRLGLLGTLSLADWNDTLATNLTAPAMLTQLLLPELQASRGSVVMVSSIHANLTKPGFAAYAASKGGLVSLAKALAVELGPSGVRVNAVLPAATNTPMLRAGFESAGNLAGLSHLHRLHPVQRICDPREIGEFILFLADSSKSGFINGSALQIDGGIGCSLLDPASLAPSEEEKPLTPALP